MVLVDSVDTEEEVEDPDEEDGVDANKGTFLVQHRDHGVQEVAVEDAEGRREGGQVVTQAYDGLVVCLPRRHLASV